MGARKCPHDKKEDGSSVNDDTTSKKMLQEKQAETKAQKAKEEESLQHYTWVVKLYRCLKKLSQMKNPITGIVMLIIYSTKTVMWRKI